MALLKRKGRKSLRFLPPPPPQPVKLRSAFSCPEEKEFVESCMLHGLSLSEAIKEVGPSFIPWEEEDECYLSDWDYLSWWEANNTPPQECWCQDCCEAQDYKLSPRYDGWNEPLCPNSRETYGKYSLRGCYKCGSLFHADCGCD